jgi:tetratricopeptide (TPR) repeat protein
MEVIILRTMFAIFIRSSILIAVAIFTWLPAIAQVDELPYDEWIEALSARHDPNFDNFKKVLFTLEAIDSSLRCKAVNELVHRPTDGNPYVTIRLSLLRSHFSHYTFSCDKDARDLRYMQDVLRLAYTVEDPYLIAQSNKMIGYTYFNQRLYGQAVMHYTLALEIEESLGFEKFPFSAFDPFTLGEALYHTREYKQALHYMRWGLELAASMGAGSDADPLIWMFSYNTLGLTYQKLGMYDSAFVNFDKALTLAKANNQSEWIGLINGNRGDIFYQLGQYDSAYTLLLDDMQKSLLGGKLYADNAANSMQWLARIKIKRGQTREAIAELHKANQLLKTLPSPKVQANIYYGFIEAYRQLQNTDSLYAYMQRYITVHDSIERAAAEAQAEFVQMRLDNQNNIHEISALNKEKRRIALIRNFMIVITLMGFAFGILYYNRQRLRMRLRQQKMQEEKKKVEAEVAAAREQLEFFTLHMLEKNTLVERLQEKLTTREVSDEQRQTISELSHHAILTDQDWARFKVLFEKVYPGFLHQIKTIAPDITSAELRVAALSKLRLTSKEASNLLGISHASVNKTRQRLRHRLDLDQSTILEEFLNAQVTPEGTS